MTKETTPTRRTGGRLRNEEAHAAVLAATAELLEESGYQGVTIEGVARRADVAKSTVYRWWNSKPVLVMDAYRRTVETRMPQPDTGDLRADLTAFVAALYAIAGHPLRVKALRGLMAEAQLSADFEGPFREWIESRRDALKDILARGLPPGADLDLAADQVFGPFWYRLLVGHAPLDPGDAPAVVAQLLDGLTRTRAASADAPPR